MKQMAARDERAKARSDRKGADGGEGTSRQK